MGPLDALVDAFQALGGAIIGVFKWFIGLFGIPVPDWVPQLASVIVLILLVLRYGKHLGRLILIVLLLLIASVVLSALFP